MYRKLLTSEMHRADKETYKSSGKLNVHVIMDNVRSHHNVGSVFRTCDAFLMDKIWLCGITPAPPHRDIHKTALGAEQTVNWEHRADVVSCCKDLKEQGFVLVAVEQCHGSVSLSAGIWNTKNPVAIVFGNEVTGVSDEVLRLCQACVEIPQEGTKHSLNVSVAAGIVLWEVYCNYKQKF